MNARISFEVMGRSSRFGLAVEVSDKNSFPILPLIFDSAPRSVAPSRVLAAGLILGRVRNQPVSFSGSLAPDVKRSLEEATGCLIDSGVDNRKEQDDIKSTCLTVDTNFSIPENTLGRDMTRLQLLPSERFYGNLRGVKEIIVGSNAWFLEKALGSCVLVAAGLLYSQDLLVKTLSVSGITESTDFKVMEEICSIFDLELVGE